MGINLVGISELGIGKVVHESGLNLTADQVRGLVEAENACLAECGRLTFGESAAARIVREFVASPFMTDECAAETLVQLTECFYELREDFPAFTTDAEILESLVDAFDGDAAGDVGLAAVLTSEALTKRLDYSTYEITDDDGNVYCWNPEEWHDDVMADGWCGERWENADE